MGTESFAELLEPATVSHITKLAVNTLAKLRVRGGGPPFLKLGTKVVYRASDVQEWLAAQRTYRSTADLADRQSSAATARRRGRPRKQTIAAEPPHHAA